MTNKKLEICCYSVESAIRAQSFGADRIELCSNYPEGGTTPSYGAVQLTLEKLNIPVNVMIRPRGGDFLYSTVEYEVIKKDVLTVKEMQANGIVIGFLKPNGDIDLNRTKEMVELAHPMEVTFHRAFDLCRDPLSALEQLKDTGVTRILTSGTKRTVMEGIELLSEWVEKAGDEISIMPGCGVNEVTLGPLMEKTGAREFHSTAKTFENSRMEYFNRNVSVGGADRVDEYQIISVDGDRIQVMVQILKAGS